MARVWSPHEIPTFALQQQVLAQMQEAERGFARLRAAQERLTPEAVQKVVLSLNAPPAKIEDLDSLHKLVIALEHEAELAETRS